ncbi:hypothetical protein DVH24_041138 [Malus domestica]|uniref:Uncharacterized protein n=1 Tax=Malus domestica TaxID=3750 RepID=A0A498IEI4_MALDO|nr:hypothetical protein DVH24_041138 [Malus domestica]
MLINPCSSLQLQFSSSSSSSSASSKWPQTEENLYMSKKTPHFSGDSSLHETKLISSSTIRMGKPGLFETRIGVAQGTEECKLTFYSANISVWTQGHTHTSIQFAHFLLEMAEASEGRGSQSNTSAMSRTEIMSFPPNSEIPWANPLVRSSTVDGVTMQAKD